MMRICEVTPYSLAQVSGVSAVVAGLSVGFSSRGHPTLVVAPAPPAAPPLDGPTCIAVHTGAMMRNLTLALRVIRVVWKRRANWDLLHLHQGHPVTVCAALLARILGRPAAATFHLQPPPGAGLRGRVQAASTRWALLAATERIFVSEDTRRDLRAKGEVVPNGIDLRIVQRSMGDRERIRVELGLGGCVVVFAGRIARIKGVFDLLRALRVARDAGADVRLIMTGQIPTEERRDFEVLLPVLDEIVEGFVEVFAPELWDGYDPPGPYPAGTRIPLVTQIYARIDQFIDEAIGTQAVIPPVGGAVRGNIKARYCLAFRYGTLRRLSSATGMRLVCGLVSDEPYTGERATATFYCTSRNE